MCLRVDTPDTERGAISHSLRVARNESPVYDAIDIGLILLSMQGYCCERSLIKCLSCGRSIVSGVRLITLRMNAPFRGVGRCLCKAVVESPGLSGLAFRIHSRLIFIGKCCLKGSLLQYCLPCPPINQRRYLQWQLGNAFPYQFGKYI